MPDKDRPLLAVLIDADNESAGLADAIINEINGLGEPGIRRVYADWSDPKLGKWAAAAKDLGLVMRQATAHNKQKNATDIELVIDAMDILREGRFDGFVLVSGDSDFTALGNRLREDGLMVVGMGKKAKAAQSFIKICNRYIFLENIDPEEKPAPNKTAPSNKKNELGVAFHKIYNAMRKVDPDGEWFPLSVVGKMVMQTYPDFDPRTYGHDKLSQLIDAIEKLELKKFDDNSLMVRRKP